MTARLWTPPRAANILSAMVLTAGLGLIHVQGAVAQDAAAPTAAPVAAAAPVKHHGLSLVGELQYKADFKHFDWVNPDAPKGGAARLRVDGTFDNLNQFTIDGVPAAGIGLVNDTLMATSLDEPSAEYGLIAEWVSHPPDFASATFGLRKEARFHDGKPVTVEDVIFSLDIQKKVNPFLGKYFKNVVKAEKTGENEVTFTFDKAGNRELPHILGQLNVLPKHYWEAKNEKGEARDLAKTTLEAPLGSGAYKIKSVDAGRSIVYERVKDYWAANLPVMKGQNNFDELKFTYFRDRTASFEEFKSGKIDFWQENTSRAWASQYGFDAVKNGLVKKEAVPLTNTVSRMQGFAMNLRRLKFQDVRVRQALNLAFNFEDLNKQITFGLYQRVGSYFDNSELKAAGLPEGRELEILKEFESELPKDLFTKEWKNPVYNTADDARMHLKQALDLLKDAGWTVNDEEIADPSCGAMCKLMRSVGLGSAKKARVLRNAKGEALEIEFLVPGEMFNAHISHYIQNLALIGIKGVIRQVDESQYQKRENTFDFDVVVANFGQSLSPGNEQRDYWSSAAAEVEGTRNVMGIKNPVIDKIIDKIVFAKDRAELVASTKALDRVLLWGHYLVPHWHNPAQWIAYWDRLGKPQKLPSQSSGFPEIWWYDDAKAKALDTAMKK
jgi:microcin C transport system substrate-binding protein